MPVERVAELPIVTPSLGILLFERMVLRYVVDCDDECDRAWVISEDGASVDGCEWEENSDEEDVTVKKLRGELEGVEEVVKVGVDDTVDFDVGTDDDDIDDVEKVENVFCAVDDIVDGSEFVVLADSLLAEMASAMLLVVLVVVVAVTVGDILLAGKNKDFTLPLVLIVLDGLGFGMEDYKDSTVHGKEQDIS
jgi:hypothetical protein